MITSCDSLQTRKSSIYKVRPFIFLLFLLVSVCVFIVSTATHFEWESFMCYCSQQLLHKCGDAVKWLPSILTNKTAKQRFLKAARIHTTWLNFHLRLLNRKASNLHLILYARKLNFRILLNCFYFRRIFNSILSEFVIISTNALIHSSNSNIRFGALTSTSVTKESLTNFGIDILYM